MQDKKVAVVSGNNAAVLNVQEKLERKGYHFFVASLGKQENKRNFCEFAEGGHDRLGDGYLGGRL